MTVKDILFKYPNLPRHLKDTFILECAHDVKNLLKDERSLKAIETVELLLRGKISKEEVRDANVISDAFDAVDELYASYPDSHVVSNSIYNASYAAAYSLYAIYTFHDQHNFITETVRYASDAQHITDDKYVCKLLELIDALDEMEKLMYLN